MALRLLSFLALAAALLAACELQEVTTAEPQPFVVAEIVLRAGVDTQTAYLHAGLGGDDVRVRNARVRVFVPGGADTLVYAETVSSECFSQLPQQAELVGSCYTAIVPAGSIRPGELYRLEVVLADGGTLSGETRVPGALDLLRPADPLCALPPDTSLELTWRAVNGAWVYVVEAELRDIFPILVARGVVPDTPNVPLRLSGLSITAADTTLVLPGELGLFDRFNSDLHPILLALRDGLPEGVSGEVLVAAADRNYVNWARGGNFNPSGLVRVPSVRGAGTGVFGSISPARFRLRVARDLPLPSCLP